MTSFWRKIRVSFASDDRELKKKGRSLQRKHHFKILLSGRFTVLRHGHVSHADMKISCRRLADYVNKLHQGASRTCSTIIFPHSTNQIIRELSQPRRRRQQERLNFAYMIVKNNSFARFARAVFIFDILLMFSFFLRREMTCLLYTSPSPRDA